MYIGEIGSLLAVERLRVSQIYVLFLAHLLTSFLTSSKPHVTLCTHGIVYLSILHV